MMHRHSLKQKETNDALPFPQNEKSNDTLAMLLYEGTTGITLFSFDGSCLNDLVKDFWTCLPPLSLIVSMKYEKVPTPIDLVNEAIDDRLFRRLTKLCGSEKTLVVGSAKYKRIIETILAITYLCVEVPDSEVIIRSLKNPMQSVKINVVLATLLYQAPSGIAIFCFDGDYLKAPMKDFWACLPQLSLVAFIKREKMPTPIDVTNEVIDGRLVKRLSQLCGSGRKLVVGSAEYKRIIETKLGVTCLHVDVPDCEVIICGLNNPMSPLLPEKQFGPDKDLELFLHQRDFDIKLEMVDKSMKETAYLLHDIESCEKKYLKFFRLLLKDFILTSEIDTKDWVLIQFATALKMICYPGAWYKVLPPDEIFSFDECSKIEAHACRYKRRFSKIDVLSIYKHVAKLNSKKCILMIKLDIWISKAKEAQEKADVRD
ncbi:hypothetical protein CFC21_014719 [Triticum aestivum]|uniref:FBD domain-containing protein n=2 Tax=Triticum aestivum TaxID=4565 RepID=A0A9R1IZJ5_WHEAT|nr:uncharacterized protein LOC123187078 [Triticum aestivum]KAF6998612.1 hypothetical protein CFC21_014719 [Triticum aestivum]